VTLLWSLRIKYAGKLLMKYRHNGPNVGVYGSAVGRTGRHFIDRSCDGCKNLPLDDGLPAAGLNYVSDLCSP
jgi:hypothetical protein